MSVLGWDEHKLLHDPNGVDHYCDGALYAKRGSAHYAFQPDLGKPLPARGSNEWFQAEHQRLREELAARAKDSNRSNRRLGRGNPLVH
jgi:hypothetical protein